MSPWLGRCMLVASGLGFPLTQSAIRWLGRPGAVLVEGVALGLLARDAALIATGTPARLRPGAARLLYAETAAAAASAVLGVTLVTSAGARAAAGAKPSAGGPPPPAREILRRFAVGTLFGMHTMRFRIYLTPSRGLREAPGGIA